MRCHLTLVRMAFVKHSKNQGWSGRGEMRTLLHRCWNVNRKQPLWNLCVLSLQSCLTLSGPVDCNPPGSSLHGVPQAGILEWVALPSFRGSSWSRDRSRVSYVSCIDRRVLYHWATWETLKDLYQICILQWLSLICSGYEFNKIISHIIWRRSPVVYCARAVLLRFYQACELPGGLVATKSVI